MCKVDTVHHSMVSKWYRQYWVCVTHSLPLSWSELYHCFILVEASLTNILAMPAGRNFIIFCISVCEYLCLGLGVHPVWVAAGQPGMAVTAQLTVSPLVSSAPASDQEDQEWFSHPTASCHIRSNKKRKQHKNILSNQPWTIQWLIDSSG